MWIGEDGNFPTPSRAVRMCVKSKACMDQLLYSISSSDVWRIPSSSFPLPPLNHPPTHHTHKHTHTRRHTYTHTHTTHPPHVLFSSLWEGCTSLWRVLPKSCSRPISSSVFKGWYNVSVYRNIGVRQSRWARSAVPLYKAFWVNLACSWTWTTARPGLRNLFSPQTSGCCPWPCFAASSRACKVTALPSKHRVNIAESTRSASTLQRLLPCGAGCFVVVYPVC